MSYPSVILADSPARYYHLSETGSGPFADSSGNGFDLTPNATIVSGSSLVPSSVDGSTALDYSQAYYTAASTTKYSQQPMSIEFWVAPLSLTGSSGGVSYVVSSGAPGGWGCGYVDGTGQWRFVSHAVVALTFAAAATTLLTYHVVFVVGASGNSVDLYINGVFSERQTPGSPLAATTVPVQVGGDTTVAYAQCYVDEFALYPTALSANQIAAHYNAGVGLAGGKLALMGVGA